ncbi:YhcN/YlaJ family sporulation lipoprotein [Pseudalkalibacillus sp. SCS-8]|uniref:YhcN/YlaJ family sporulation lipoprotein n=1 Tax=Pseudalkalibacillus nanhaiensis TaxID=3115291 RepID=UPI0032D9E6DB
MGVKWSHKAKFLLLSGVLCTSLVACNNNDDMDNGNGDGAETQNINENGGLINDEDNNGVNGNNRFEIADKAAEKIANLPEVEDANVFVTDENAYVAAELKMNTKGEITRDLERKISQQVKATDPDIDNVYVSTNPDFFNRTGDYADRVEQGEPIEGMFEEFNEMARRIFPNAR